MKRLISLSLLTLLIALYQAVWTEAAIPLPSAPGDKGSHVWQTQQRLRALGFLKAEVDGVFGTELKLPVNVKGGKTVNTRIVGVDGPRWMLRGIFSGKAAIDPDSPETEALNKFFAGIVVERGEEPLAPRDLIPMHPPVAPAERKAAKAAAEAGEANGKEHFKDIPDNKPKGPLSQDQQTEVKTTLSRGPMFSEVR